MQKPIKKLKQSGLYQIATSVTLHQKEHPHSHRIATIPSDSIVMFLEYSTGSVRKCKILFGEMIGWIVVDRKYTNHTYFFKEVKNNAKDE